MRIGVLSSYGYICKVNNYGSLLQYFALQTYLERNGYEVYWIRFVKDNSNHNFIIKYLRSKLFNSNFKIPTEHYSKTDFDFFIKKYIKVSEYTYNSYTDIKTNPPKADFFIVGSDQVWNGYSPERYLMFVPDGKPKISYAVSFGKNNIKNYLKPLMWYYLKGFKAISVREKIAIDICSSIGRKNIKHVIDPTFLLLKKDYMDFIDNEKIIPEKEPYIFCYFVNPFEKNIFPYKRNIDIFKEETQHKLIITAIQGAEKAFDKSYIRNPSPLKWIELIANADYILTNSFHGMAFSIIMRKKFLVIPQKGFGEEQNSRQTNLLATLNLNDRIYNENISILQQIERPIKWEIVEHKINQFVDYSKDFLKKNLD